MRYFDAHSDILYDVAARRQRGERHVLEKVHLPELLQGGVEGACFSIWLDPEVEDPVKETHRFLKEAGAELESCPAVKPVRWAEEALEARARGQFYVFLSVEGLDAIGSDVGKVADYAAVGCRSAMLTWNGENALACGASCGNEKGLTPAGRRAVKELYRHQMLLDTSHLNERSFWEAIAVAEGPILASHSNARSLCDVPRNLTDAQLRAIRDSGGVVGLNSWHRFIDVEPQRQTVQRLAEHAMHIIEVCGVEHVGCGFDFCGYLPGMENDKTIGLSDSADAQNLFCCLMEKGVKNKELEQIAVGNFLRVLGKKVFQN